MAFAILWISRTRCLRISAAAKFWEVAAGTKRCREVHRTAGEHGVHDSDRPGVRYDLRRQGTLVHCPSLFVDSSAAWQPWFSAEPQSQDRPKAYRDGDDGPSGRDD